MLSTDSRVLDVWPLLRAASSIDDSEYETKMKQSYTLSRWRPRPQCCIFLIDFRHDFASRVHAVRVGAKTISSLLPLCGERIQLNLFLVAEIQWNKVHILLDQLVIDVFTIYLAYTYMVAMGALFFSGNDNPIGSDSLFSLQAVHTLERSS